MKKLIISLGAIFAVCMGHAQTHDRLEEARNILRTDSISFAQFRSLGICHSIDRLTKKKHHYTLFVDHYADLSCLQFALTQVIVEERIQAVIDRHFEASLDSVILQLKRNDESRKDLSPFIIAETIFSPTPQLYKLYSELIEDDDSYYSDVTINTVLSRHRFFPNPAYGGSTIPEKSKIPERLKQKWLSTTKSVSHPVADQPQNRLDSIKHMLRTDSVAFAQFRSMGVCHTIDLLTTKSYRYKLFMPYYASVAAQRFALPNLISHERIMTAINQHYVLSRDSVILQLRRHDEYYNENRSPLFIAEAIFAPTPQVYELYLDVIDDDDSYSFFQADNDIGWSVWRFFPNTLHSENRFSKDAKGVALCRCVSQLHVNPSGAKDYSQSYFVEYSELSPEQIHRINMYVDSVIQNYQLPPKEIDGNMNGLTCWKLYESKELERFIKRLSHTLGEV